ncbi:MAG: hypothetical protein AAF664_24495 [Planctomycetota bacterium]
MRNLVKSIQQYWLTIILGMLALALFVTEQCFAIGVSALEFQIGDPAVSQIPQLFSSHFLHWSKEHLFWDLGVFLALCGVGERISRTGTSIVLAIAGLLIPLGVSAVHFDIETYRGLSGLDTALFGWVVTWFAVDTWKKSDRVATLFCLFLLAAMIAKTIHEYSTGTIFVNDNNFLPVPVAHVIGGMIGVTAAAASFQTTTKALST